MWFQSKEYLKWSRMHFLTPQNKNAMLDFMSIKSHSKVLDVGCGTGEFTRYIGVDPSCHYIGLDIEADFIETAKKAASSNAMFVCGDALALPFSDNTFDVVVSHTFFTCISNPFLALSEMKRVCKVNGKIISVTADSFTRIPFSSGTYPPNDWINEYRRLRGKIDKLFLPIANDAMKGLKPEIIPKFFSDAGLTEVSVSQIGKFFSLSNATLTEVQRNEYLEAEYEAECIRAQLLSPDERAQYIRILKMRKQYLSVPENTIWEWSGGSNLIIVGTNRK